MVKRFPLSLPEGLHRDLKAAAQDRGQPLNGLIKTILWEWNEEKKKAAPGWNPETAKAKK